MTTASKLDGQLGALKRRLGLTLIKFEDAGVELEPFVRAHVFDTAAYLLRQMYAHFKDVSNYRKMKIHNLYTIAEFRTYSRQDTNLNLGDVASHRSRQLGCSQLERP